MPATLTNGSYGVQVEGLEAVVAAFQAAPEMARREMERTIREATMHMWPEVVNRTPAATGNTRDAILPSFHTNADGWPVGMVSSPDQHLAALELGSKPHHPPITPLIDWVEKVLDPFDAEEAEDIAQAIAWKISHRGTKGHFMFRDAIDANEAWLIAQFQAAGARIVEQWGRG